jgi:hypothetical protein
MMGDPSLWKDSVSVISATTALVAVIVGPLVSWKIAKRQIAASNVSSKRQVWIDELRKDVAEALALLSRIEELKRPSPDLSREEQLDVFDTRMEAELRAVELLMRVKLRLNPNEQAHNDLVAAFEELSRAAPDPQSGETDEARRRLQAEFGAARENVLKITQKILKSEWNRVRRGA